MASPLWSLLLVLVCTPFLQSLTSTKCSPDSFERLSGFLVSRWNESRVELGLPVIRYDDRGYLDVEHRRSIAFMSSFYSFSDGIVVYWNANNDPVVYAKIWKCANEAIRTNMGMQLMTKKSKNTKALGYSVKSRFEHIMARDFMNKYTPRKHGYNNTFTFVRDPVSHFVSGLAESVWRSFNGGNTTVTTQMVANYMKSFLNFQYKSLKWIEHTFPMSGAFFQHNISFVGQLESFDDDWQILHSKYNLFRAFDKNLGVHPSSDDPNGAKTAIRLLLAQEPQYLRALCQLLMVDYVCFSTYTLPPGCDHLDPIRREGGRLLVADTKPPVT